MYNSLSLKTGNNQLGGNHQYMCNIPHNSREVPGIIGRISLFGVAIMSIYTPRLPNARVVALRHPSTLTAVSQKARLSKITQGLETRGLE
jgi:hypothetical protein